MKDKEVPWARVREIFEAALGLESPQRAEFVSASCQGDADLRREVEALLEAAADRDFLAEPVAPFAIQVLEDTGHRDGAGVQVGPFRLVERLGKGGMGDVYAADRIDGGFSQRVAIKLIRAAFPDGDLIQRFERERSILAGLSHPNIAHLLDGGLSDEGPYLAMEFVDGQSLLEYCDQRTLSTSERLALFATVCDAVHSAHQQLVVHRDLKPSNVLVTKEGRVELLDFGIARLTEGVGRTPEPLTRTGLHLMTPEYASPEQIRGEPASTASDLYSLGVLLFELLTGQRPYDLKGLSPAAVERRISEEPPTRPSEAVLRNGIAPSTGEPTDARRAGEARSTRPERLGRILKEDLDTEIDPADIERELASLKTPRAQVTE